MGADRNSLGPEKVYNMNTNKSGEYRDWFTKPKKGKLNTSSVIRESQQTFTLDKSAN